MYENQNDFEQQNRNQQPYQNQQPGYENPNNQYNNVQQNYGYQTYDQLNQNSIYMAEMQKEKGDGIGLGIASMVLGILSLLLFCTGCNIIMIILAVIFGIIQLVKNKQKGFAITGLITSGVSLLLFIVLYAFIIITTGSMDVYDYYDNYYNGYYDDYNGDYGTYDYNAGSGYDTLNYSDMQEMLEVNLFEIEEL